MHHIIFDLEATCWDGAPPNDIQEIIEIGAIRVDRYGDSVDQFHAFVKPQVNPRLSRYCLNLTGIEQAEVNRAHSFDDVIIDFIDWIQLEVPNQLYSWGKLDRKLLISNCELFGLEPDEFMHTMDLKSEYREMKSLSSTIGLKKALRYEGIEFEGREHRALDDALNLKEIFVRYIDEWQL